MNDQATGDGEAVARRVRRAASAALPDDDAAARALADAERAVALRPEWAKGHTRQAAAMHGLGRYMAAVLAYDAALAIEPGNEMLLDARRQSSFTLAVEKD